MASDHIVIVGGGFSGTLLAINLLRNDGPTATVIERRPRAAQGAAYSTLHPEHLLNVRASGMSALPDEPAHFQNWLRAHGLPGDTAFVPRRLYGTYLADLLAETMAAAPDRLTIVQGEAIDVVRGPARALVMLADGRAVEADRVALALGNLPPLVPGRLDPATLPAGCYVEDPWTAPIAEGLDADDTVIVLGTGLTMIDVALLLDTNDFRGRIVALSRRGLLPRAHADVAPVAPLPERPRVTARALLGSVRARARALPWRAAIDELRPHTQRIWGAMPLAERARFLRHVRPWWDVHRHRIAPQVAQRLEAMRHSGRLEVRAGHIDAAEPIDGGVRVRYRPRGSDRSETVDGARIVNATGPQGDLTRSGEPLLRALYARGEIRPDPLRIGVDVDQQSRALAADGSASDRLVVVGPMTRGAFWEIVAVPDIRHQVWSIARRLSRAEWVEGEGL
jgi:uncharacterized NAD(P)/FAD-binding protein YdhS